MSCFFLLQGVCTNGSNIRMRVSKQGPGKTPVVGSDQGTRETADCLPAGSMATTIAGLCLMLRPIDPMDWPPDVGHVKRQIES